MSLQKKQKPNAKRRKPFKTLIISTTQCSMGFPHSSVGRASACNAGDLGSIPRWKISPGEGNGYPLQYSCLEIPWREEPGKLQLMGSQESDMTQRYLSFQ